MRRRRGRKKRENFGIICKCGSEDGLHDRYSNMMRFPDCSCSVEELNKGTKVKEYQGLDFVELEIGNGIAGT